MSVILYVEIYEKRFHVQLNSHYSTAVGFKFFLVRKTKENVQPMIPVARGTPVLKVAQEN